MCTCLIAHFRWPFIFCCCIRILLYYVIFICLLLLDKIQVNAWKIDDYIDIMSGCAHTRTHTHMTTYSNWCCILIILYAAIKCCSTTRPIALHIVATCTVHTHSTTLPPSKPPPSPPSTINSQYNRCEPIRISLCKYKILSFIHYYYIKRYNIYLIIS